MRCNNPDEMHYYKLTEKVGITKLQIKGMLKYITFLAWCPIKT